MSVKNTWTIIKQTFSDFFANNVLKLSGSLAFFTVFSMPGLIIIIIFGVRAALGQGPWEYIVYGVLAEILLIWTLRPNIKRLMEGNERRHGLPEKLLQKKKAKGPKNND